MRIVEAPPPLGRFVDAHPRPAGGLFQRRGTTEINEAAVGKVAQRDIGIVHFRTIPFSRRGCPPGGVSPAGESMVQPKGLRSGNSSRVGNRTARHNDVNLTFIPANSTCTISLLKGSRLVKGSDSNYAVA